MLQDHDPLFKTAAAKSGSQPASMPGRADAMLFLQRCHGVGDDGIEVFPAGPSLSPVNFTPSQQGLPELE